MKRRSLLTNSLWLSVAAGAGTRGAMGVEVGGPQSTKPRWARVWRGRTRVADFDSYAAYLYSEGCKAIEAIPGNLGVQMLRRTVGNKAEFVVISYWPDLEAIKHFAGEDISLAHPLEKDPRFLLSLPHYVDHFEIYAED